MAAEGGQGGNEPDDRPQNPDVAHDQPGRGHAAATLAGLADLATSHVPEDDRRNASYEPEEDLAEAADQGGHGHLVGARHDSRVCPWPVRHGLAQVGGQGTELVVGLRRHQAR